jgi:hypothetical protein
MIKQIIIIVAAIALVAGVAGAIAARNNGASQSEKQEQATVKKEAGAREAASQPDFAKARRMRAEDGRRLSASQRQERPVAKGQGRGRRGQRQRWMGREFYGGRFGGRGMVQPRCQCCCCQGDRVTDRGPMAQRRTFQGGWGARGGGRFGRCQMGMDRPRGPQRRDLRRIPRQQGLQREQRFGYRGLR